MLKANNEFCETAEPDEILSLLADKLIEGWDPPDAVRHISDEFKARINYRVNVSAVEFEGKGGGGTSRTECDSHANMCVVGKHCIIISRSGKTINVGTFSPSAGSLSAVPIVDAVIAYDCRRTGQTYLLVLRNALYVPEMEENLISPFILREAGLIVNECAKQHRPFGEATDDDHAIICKEPYMKITMGIRSTFLLNNA